MKIVIDKNVKFLALNSFFTDISTEMILPLLPIFLERFLHASKTEIGFIEGLAEFSAAFLIALSGFYSDKINARKSVALFGYTLSNLTKPLMVFVSSVYGVMAIRIVDRVGKGIRTAPRDALISSYTHKKNSGLSFGFHKMMDSGGAFLGSLVAFFILTYYSASESAFRTIFALSLIPGILAFITLAFFVKEAKYKESFKTTIKVSLGALENKFYIFVLFQASFAAIAMNYSFFILKAQDNGMAIAMLPLAYALFNFSQAVPAMKIGMLSDKYGKFKLLLFAYTAFILATLAFLIQTSWSAWLGFALYGLFIANFNSISKAIIADMIDISIKATAYGVYFMSIGIASFFSLLVAGFIWDSFGASTLFSIVTLLSATLLFVGYRFMLPRIEE